MIFQNPYSTLPPHKTIGKMLKEVVDYHEVADKHEAKEYSIFLLVLIIVPVIFIAVWMLLSLKKDTIETSETILKIGLTIFASLIYISFLFQYLHYTYR